MNERIIELTEINPSDLFGTQNSNVDTLRKYFPKLKIVARGTSLKAYGEPEILDEFEKRLEMLIAYFNRYLTPVQRGALYPNRLLFLFLA